MGEVGFFFVFGFLTIVIKLNYITLSLSPLGNSRPVTAQTRGTSRTPGTATTATAAGTNRVSGSYSRSHNRHPGDETYVSDDTSFVTRAKRGGSGDVEDGDSFSMSGVSGMSGYYPDEIGRGGRWDDREGSIK